MIDSLLTKPEWFLNLSAVAAFGFMGSLHCAGMCGPIAAAACHSQKNENAFDFLKYHLSRALTYGLLGTISGLTSSAVLHQAVEIQKFHSQYLGLAMAMNVLLYALYEIYQLRTKHKKTHRLNHSIIYLQRFLPVSRPVALGMMTALFPCGFLFAALLQSALIANPLLSGLSMVIFALATIPALSIGTGLLLSFRRIYPRSADILIPLVFVFLSLAFIMRSVNLMEHHHHAHQDAKSPDEQTSF